MTGTGRIPFEARSLTSMLSVVCAVALGSVLAACSGGGLPEFTLDVGSGLEWQCADEGGVARVISRDTLGNREASAFRAIDRHPSAEGIERDWLAECIMLVGLHDDDLEECPKVVENMSCLATLDTRNEFGDVWARENAVVLALPNSGVSAGAGSFVLACSVANVRAGIGATVRDFLGLAFVDAASGFESKIDIKEVSTIGGVNGVRVSEVCEEAER